MISIISKHLNMLKPYYKPLNTNAYVNPIWLVEAARIQM